MDRIKLFILECAVKYYALLSKANNKKRAKKILKYQKMIVNNDFKVNKLERKFSSLLDLIKGENYFFRRNSNKKRSEMETNRIRRKKSGKD